MCSVHSFLLLLEYVLCMSVVCLCHLIQVIAWHMYSHWSHARHLKPLYRDCTVCFTSLYICRVISSVLCSLVLVAVFRLRGVSRGVATTLYLIRKRPREDGSLFCGKPHSAGLLHNTCTQNTRTVEKNARQCSSVQLEHPRI